MKKVSFLTLYFCNGSVYEALVRLNRKNCWLTLSISSLFWYFSQFSFGLRFCLCLSFFFQFLVRVWSEFLHLLSYLTLSLFFFFSVIQRLSDDLRRAIDAKNEELKIVGSNTIQISIPASSAKSNNNAKPLHYIFQMESAETKEVSPGKGWKERNVLRHSYHSNVQA